VVDSNRLIWRILQSGHWIKGSQPAPAPDELPAPDMGAEDATGDLMQLLDPSDSGGDERLR